MCIKQLLLTEPEDSAQLKQRLTTRSYLRTLQSDIQYKV
jgi:hypothetical protein